MEFLPSNLSPTLVPMLLLNVIFEFPKFLSSPIPHSVFYNFTVRTPSHASHFQFTVSITLLLFFFFSKIVVLLCLKICGRLFEFFWYVTPTIILRLNSFFLFDMSRMVSHFLFFLFSITLEMHFSLFQVN